MVTCIQRREESQPNQLWTRCHGKSFPLRFCVFSCNLSSWAGDEKNFVQSSKKKGETHHKKKIKKLNLPHFLAIYQFILQKHIKNLFHLRINIFSQLITISQRNFKQLTFSCIRIQRLDLTLTFLLIGVPCFWIFHVCTDHLLLLNNKTKSTLCEMILDRIKVHSHNSTFSCRCWFAEHINVNKFAQIYIF